MAENKTKPTEGGVTEFIGAIADPVKRADAKAIAALMRRATGEKPKMWGPSIVGFGSKHYKYETGREGDSPVVAFSPRKAATVLYGATGFDGAADLLARLGKHTMGKGCLYIKKLADVDSEALEALIAGAVSAKKDAKRERSAP